jgi:DNA-binding transcriptional regulator YiaG
VSRPAIPFAQRVDASTGSSSCWVWLGEHDGDGYGRARVEGRRVGAHRMALEEKLGRPLASGMCACHTCDNPGCVNPAHLFEGSRADNNRDMVAKGHLRALAAHRNSQAKLTGTEVLEIRDLIDIPDGALARRFGVHSTTIAAIQRGERYVEWTR